MTSENVAFSLNVVKNNHPFGKQHPDRSIPEPAMADGERLHNVLFL